MKRSLLVLAALLIPMFGAVAAHADSIVVTETTTAAGSLDGIGFTNALVTLTLTGSTTNVSSLGGVFELPGTATVSVLGDGADTFTDNVNAVVNQNFEDSGFGDFTNNFGILFTQNPALSTYDLESSIGPLSGTDSFNKNVAFSTLGGAFDITFTTGSATFTATVGNVPEPSCLLLLGMGFASLLGMSIWKNTVRRAAWKWN
jgi:hypothetical protein